MSGQDALRHRVARTIWTTSRNDEGTISATGANIVADAVLAELAPELERAGALRASLATAWSAYLDLLLAKTFEDGESLVGWLLAADPTLATRLRGALNADGTR